MDFIFMLTRRDETIHDCLDLLEVITPLGLQHIGFKDVGVDVETLATLTRRIKALGATSYLEVVSPDPEHVLSSTRSARQIGVDCLLGGTDVAAVQRELEGSSIAYFPFPGRPEGHPTRLGGSPGAIAQDSARFMGLGCAGVDLLAFRATESEPLDLVRSARRALGGQGRLIVAGSVDSPETIRAIEEAGADAFTIGSAVLEGRFSPRKGLVISQLRDVLAACG